MDRYNAAAWLVDRHIDEGRGERAAIRFGGGSVTYRELQRDVMRTQHALVDMGFEAGDRIAMVANDEPAFVAWFLGAQRGGFVPVPLSTMLGGQELAPIVADSGAVAVIVSTEHENRLAPIAQGCAALTHAVVLGDPQLASPANVTVLRADDFDSAEVPVAPTTAASEALWLYSSGTTGVPKGVIHLHASLQATADSYATQVLETTPDDRFFSMAKLFFAYGLGNSLTFPLAVGGTAILDARAPTPAGVLETIGTEQPTLFFATPGFVAALLDSDADPAALESVRATVTAGEALPADLANRFANRFGHPILDGIGSTEALHIFISNTLAHQEPGSSGEPVPGYELELRDDGGAVIDAADTPGYLHVRGPSNAAGYWDRPDDTAAAFLGDWMKTGDVYTRSATGYWSFLGRNTDMIKAGGIWVSPAEVEAVLIEHRDVLEAAVVGDRDAHGLETVVAFVVAASGRQIDSDVLQDHCRERMAVFKRPRTIIEVQDLPRTATGKIRRFLLREGFGDRN